MSKVEELKDLATKTKISKSTKIERAKAEIAANEDVIRKAADEMAATYKSGDVEAYQRAAKEKEFAEMRRGFFDDNLKVTVNDEPEKLEEFKKLFHEAEAELQKEVLDKITAEAAEHWKAIKELSEEYDNKQKECDKILQSAVNECGLTFVPFLTSHLGTNIIHGVVRKGTSSFLEFNLMSALKKRS